MHLKFLESLFASNLSHLQHIEVHGLGKWSALSNGDVVTNLHIHEGWRHVSGQFGVSLFETVVFFDEVEVVTSDSDGSLHFQGGANAGEDTSSNANITREWAFLIDEVSVQGLCWGLESETDLSGESDLTTVQLTGV